MHAVALREVEALVVRRIAETTTVFCCLDYDGTLAPLALTPSGAAPLADAAELLGQLAALPGMHVAIATGRAIADIRTRLNAPGLCYIGIHGAEVRLPDGTSECAADTADVRAILPAIKQQLVRAFGNSPGILLEDKGLALACHYRLAQRGIAARAQETVTRAVDAYRQRGLQVVVRSGHEVTEICAAGVDKGRAVCRLLSACGPHTLAVYVGDDETDEDAFAALPSDSVTIRVGPPATSTAARYRVDDPTDVLQFIRAIATHRRALHATLAARAR